MTDSSPVQGLPLDMLLVEAAAATHPLRAIRGWDNDALGSLVGRLARFLHEHRGALAREPGSEPPPEPSEAAWKAYSKAYADGEVIVWDERKHYRALRAAYAVDRLPAGPPDVRHQLDSADDLREAAYAITRHMDTDDLAWGPAWVKLRGAVEAYDASRAGALPAGGEGGPQPFGRVYSAWDAAVEPQYQDAGRTLKIFVTDALPQRETEGP